MALPYRCRGVSLLEIMASLSLGTILLLVSMRSDFLSMAFVTANSDELIISEQLQSVVDSYRAMPFAQFTSSIFGDASLLADGAKSIKTAQVGLSPKERTATLTFTVSLSEVSGTIHSVTIDAVVPSPTSSFIRSPLSMHTTVYRLR